MKEKEEKSLRYKIGLLLLILHIIIGDVFTAILSAIAVKTGHDWLLKAGAVCYGSSWFIGGTGIILSGPEGMEAIKQLWHSIFKRSKS